MTAGTKTSPLLVLPTRTVKGFEEAEQLTSESLQLFEPLDVEEALERSWPTDAHFCFYTVTGETAMPRINKPGLTLLREAGQDVEIRFLSFDYDNRDKKGKKKEWEEADIADFLRLKNSVEENRKYASRYRAFYTTLHGVRWIYELETPVTAEKAEELLEGICSDLINCGIEVDVLSDWTRLMRMPRVNRAGHRSETDPFFFCEIKKERISADELPRNPSKYAREFSTKELPKSTPTSAEAYGRLFTKEGKETYFYRSSRKALKGKECFSCIYEGAPIASEGNRNNTIFKYAGSVVGNCYGIRGATPEGCYGLLLGSVCQLEEDPSNPEKWEDCLWRAISTSWTQEAKQRNTAQREEQEEAVRIWEQVVDGFMSWASVPGLYTREEHEEYIQDKLILYTPAGVGYIMTQDGSYNPKGYRADLVSAGIRELGMESIIPRFVPKANGEGVRAVTEKEFKNTYGFAVKEPVKNSSNQNTGLIVDFERDKPILPGFCLNPTILPVYNPEVDAWLRKLCTTDDDYRILCNWIGHSLDFVNPIAALAVIGPPAIGKQLLVRGLCENLLVPTLAEFSAEVYQETLLESPFVVANEGFPIQPRSGIRMADQLRKLVSGDLIRVPLKYRDTVEVSTYFRVIITANNHQGLQNLYAGQDLTEEDKNAIAQRLVAMFASQEAAIYLRSLGGMSYTSKKGNRWVGGPAGPSDHIVAKHFRYLHETRRPATKGSRFLVEGSVKSTSPGSGFKIIQNLAVNTRKTQDVLAILGRMLQQTEPELCGIYIREKAGPKTAPGVYTTTGAVLAFAEKLPGHKADRMGRRGVGEALRFLSTEEVRSRQVVPSEGQAVRSYRLNMPRLLEMLAEDGIVLPSIYGPFIKMQLEESAREKGQQKED